MKILYIEAKKKDSSSSAISIAGLPKVIKELFLAYSIQYESEAKAIKSKLESNHIKVAGFQQVLGCTKLKTSFPILLIGSGKFHALNLALQNKTPVYIYNNSCITETDPKELENLKKKTQIALNRFFVSNKVGILVSTKPGQENLNKAEKLKEKIIEKFPEKKAYILISNHINISEFENFDIDLFINTSCPGLINDSSKIINIDDILPFL
jgi:diphthamide biosynthesis enzyme Dph1/Dph2-like protein